jgi:hypothetical protein
MVSSAARDATGDPFHRASFFRISIEDVRLISRKVAATFAAKK